MKLQYRAWTGGSRPTDYEKLTCPVEKCLVNLIFKNLCRVYEDYWKESPNEDVKTIFWRQARYDAHATCRDEGVSRTEESLRLLVKDLEMVPEKGAEG